MKLCHVGVARGQFTRVRAPNKIFEICYLVDAESHPTYGVTREVIFEVKNSSRSQNFGGETLPQTWAFVEWDVKHDKLREGQLVVAVLG